MFWKIKKNGRVEHFKSNALKIARLKIKRVEIEDLKALLYTLKIVASIKNVIYYKGRLTLFQDPLSRQLISEYRDADEFRNRDSEDGMKS